MDRGSWMQQYIMSLYSLGNYMKILYILCPGLPFLFHQSPRLRMLLSTQASIVMYPSFREKSSILETAKTPLQPAASNYCSSLPYEYTSLGSSSGNVCSASRFANPAVTAAQTAESDIPARTLGASKTSGKACC